MCRYVGLSRIFWPYFVLPQHLQVHQFSPLPSGRRHSSHNLSPVSTIAESTDEEDTDSAEGRSPGRTQSAKNTRRMRRHQRRMSFPPPAHRSTQQHWTSRMNDRLPSSFNSLTRSASPSPTGSLTNLNEDAEAQFSSSVRQLRIGSVAIFTLANKPTHSAYTRPPLPTYVHAHHGIRNHVSRPI